MNGRARGIGIGLRHDLADELLQRRPSGVGWVEVHPENYIDRGGRYAQILDAAREQWPVITHGLTACLGAQEPFEPTYVHDLRSFLHDLEVPWHSEHLCVGGSDGRFFHDLLPLPFTEEAVAISSQRLIELRDGIDVPLALENVSYYAPQSVDGLHEVDFVNEVLERTDAKLLLDVNNVYVNSKNFGFDPKAYIDRVASERVVQIHVAGHWVQESGLRIDTHGEAVPDDVFDLLEYALGRLGEVPVLLERDNNFPPLDELLGEIDRLWAIYERATGSTRAR